MRPGASIVLGGLGGLACFAAAAVPLSWARLFVVREGYRLAEFVGVMDAGGSLGGQVMGFNYQRDPSWVHGAVWFAATLVVFGPAVAAVLALATPGGVRGRQTLCGRCGGVLRGLTEPKCPHCGGGFG